MAPAFNAGTVNPALHVLRAQRSVNAAFAEHNPPPPTELRSCTVRVELLWRPKPLPRSANAVFSERCVRRTRPLPPPKGFCLRSCAVSIGPPIDPVKIEVPALPAFGEYSVQ